MKSTPLEGGPPTGYQQLVPAFHRLTYEEPASVLWRGVACTPVHIQFLLRIHILRRRSLPWKKQIRCIHILRRRSRPWKKQIRCIHILRRRSLPWKKQIRCIAMSWSTGRPSFGSRAYWM